MTVTDREPTRHPQSRSWSSIRHRANSRLLGPPASPRPRRRHLAGDRAGHADDRRDARGPLAADRQGAGAPWRQRDDPVLRGVDANRVSFEVAAKNLSADVVNIAAATSSVTKGESLVDTVRTVEALARRSSSSATRRPGPRTSRPRHSAGRSSTAATAGTRTRPRRCSTCTRCERGCRAVPSRPEGRDPRRRPSFAGRPLQHLVADRGRRRSVAVRPGDAPPWLRDVGTAPRG